MQGPMSTRLLGRTVAMDVGRMSRALSSDAAIGDVKIRLREVLGRIAKAHDSAGPELRSAETPLLVAVSKTKPPDLILAAYEEGQRDFGENYIQELEEKANLPALRAACPDIRWHYIGTLQSNKIPKMVSGIPNLAVVQTLASEKAAKLLQAAAAKLARIMPLEVCVQVNTSGEAGKSGLEPDAAVGLAAFVEADCPALRLSGFMTIGALAHSLKASEEGQIRLTESMNNEYVPGSNPDFVRLAETRAAFAATSGRTLLSVGLSMGMSADFEEAIRAGSTSVRIGSTIFGARANKA